MAILSFIRCFVCRNFFRAPSLVRFACCSLALCRQIDYIRNENLSHFHKKFIASIFN